MNTSRAKRKTRTSAVVCLILALAQFISCGGGNDVPSESLSEPVYETSEDTTQSAAYNPPDVDYNGQVFTIFEDHFDAGYAICKYNYITSDGENGDIINDAIFKRTQAVEEALGVKIEVVSNQLVGDYTQLVNSINAGDDAFQAAYMIMNYANKLLGSGLLYDLKSIDTLDLSAGWVNQNANDEYDMLGKQYLMIDKSCLRTLVSSGLIYFNKQIVEEYQLDNPYDLVDSGKWTLDTFGQMARQVSADLNGDGTMDENDRFGFSGSSTVLKQAINSCGGRLTTKNTDGIPEITLNNERTITMIDKLLPILSDYDVNAFPSNFSSKASGGDVFVSVFLPMFKSDKLFMNFNWLFYAMDLRDMETDFGILPMPKLDEAQEKYYSQLADGWADLIAVPASVSDPEMAGHVLTAMGYYSELYIESELINRAVSTKSMRDENSARMIEIVNDGMVFDLWSLYKWGNLVNSVTGTLTAGSNNFVSAYASLEAKTNEEITKTFDALK